MGGFFLSVLICGTVFGVGAGLMLWDEKWGR